MNKKFALIFALLALVSCGVDLDFVEIDKIDNTIKQPFEALDQTNFDNASAVLSAPNSNVRLDSVVIIKFYRYVPNVSNTNQANTTLNTTLATGSDVPTNRRSEHFVYNEINQLIKIESFKNVQRHEADITKAGTKINTHFFSYNENKNLVNVNIQELNDSGDIKGLFEFIYDNNNNLIQKNILLPNKSALKIGKLNNQVTVKSFPVQDELYTTSIYSLDDFNNIIHLNKENNLSKEVENFDFKYDKNIFNPYVNLFPTNFYPFLFYDFFDGGFSHLSSELMSNYQKQIKINDQGFPEVLQIGSYDQGLRILYYYSTY